MVLVHAGTDTYGRVKNIKGTPIVTKFAMLQAFPVYPLKSFYYFGPGETTGEGIPLIAWQQSTEIRGIPLAAIDRTSALITYIRGLFGAAVIVGFLCLLVPAINFLSGEYMTDSMRMLMQIFAFVLVFGIIGGVLTYAVPLVGGRERKIREYCFELLEIAIDPARIEPDASQSIVDFANSTTVTRSDKRFELVRELVITRAKIAQTTDRGSSEFATDRILEAIEQHPQSMA